jgi:60 kDa SS-A/Ro ribonucleoprotein
MSRFNTQTIGTKTFNKEGGEAYSQSPKLELVSILLTSFANDTFYEKAEDKFDRLKDLIKHTDPLFCAKAGVYARNEFGMRSITHVLASELARYASGSKWAKNFYSAVIHRPDDMTEIISYLKANKQKIPNAIKKGFALAFSKFDTYALAKYRGEMKSIKLVDVVNLVHPVPTERNKEAIEGLVKGTLKSTDTWESKLTQAGQNAESEEDKDVKKKEAWVSLVKENKLGYFALLRNLRNIMEAVPELEAEVITQLTNRDKIKKSLVLPFRFFTAITELEKLHNTRNIVLAISDAAEISLDNVPKLSGKTLVAVDVSGSMTGKPQEIARMFGSVLYKATDSMLLTFDDRARYISLNPRDSLLSLMQRLPFTGGGTNFNAIFDSSTEKFDRVIILSDMQAWITDGWGSSNPKQAFANYKQRTGADPIIYSFDLNAYGSMQFPERNVYCLSGFSDKIFDIMKVLEEDRNALINKIESIEFKA